PKERFRLVGRTDVEEEGAVPTMQIGMERRRRSAIDERQRHLERHRRFGDTPGTLVLARSRHELARFLGVAPGTRGRKPVRGLRLAKVRPVMTHELHPACPGQVIVTLALMNCASRDPSTLLREIVAGCNKLYRHAARASTPRGLRSQCESALALGSEAATCAYTSREMSTISDRATFWSGMPRVRTTRM